MVSCSAAYWASQPGRRPAGQALSRIVASHGKHLSLPPSWRSLDR